MTPRQVWLWILGSWALAICMAATITHGFSHLASASCQWDCHWYTSLETQGYSPLPRLDDPLENGQAAWAFFPLYPLLARLITALTQLPPIWSGLVINLLLFPAIVRLAIAELMSRGIVLDWRYVAVFWAAYPLNLWYAAQYSEGSYAVCLLGAIVALRKERPGLGAACCALLALARPTGFVMATLLGAWWLFKAGKVRPTLVRLQDTALIIAAAGSGLSLYVLFLAHLTGDGFAFMHVEYAWRREFGPFWLKIVPTSLTWEMLPFYATTWLAALVIALMAFRRDWLSAILAGATFVLSTSTGVVSVERYILGNPLVIGFFAREVAGLSGRVGWAVIALCVALRCEILWMWDSTLVYLM